MLELVMPFLLAGLSGTTAEEDLFDGAPDPSAELGAESSRARVTLRTPPGWRAPFVVSGATWLASPDGAAMVLVYAADPDKVAFDAYLGAPLGTSTVKWSPTKARVTWCSPPSRRRRWSSGGRS